MRTARSAPLAAAALALIAFPAAAASPGTMTNAAAFEPSYAGNEIDGCILSFEAYQRADAADGGELVQLTGSLAVYRQPLAVMMKLAIGHLSPDRKLSFTPPAMAGLQDGGAINAASLIQSGASEDTPGAALFIYNFDAATVNLLRASLNADKIQGYFVQKAGGPVTPFAIDLGMMKQPLPGAPIGTGNGVGAMKTCVQGLVAPTP